MALTIYLDGRYVPEDEARVSVFDHGLLYGDGVFEGIRAYNGKVFKLKEHIDRIFEGIRSLRLEVTMTKEEMIEVVLETCRRNSLRDAYIRLVVSRGRGDLGLDPKNCPRPLVFCIASGIQLYPDELYEQGMELVTVPTRRNLSESVNPRMKSLNYLNNILAKMEAAQAGAPEGLLLNQEGYVAEATGDNIFIVKEQVLYTPATYAGLLKGITRDTVIELARESGVRVEETLFTRHDVYNADECFLTGTAAELIPVVKLDQRVVGDGSPGPLTKDLMQRYRELTRNSGAII